MLTFLLILIIVCILYFVRRKLIRQRRLIEELKRKIERLSARNKMKTSSKFDWFGRG